MFAIPDDMVQYIPKYHISLYDKNLDYKDFERKMNMLVEGQFGENWLPGNVKCYDEPLKKCLIQKSIMNLVEL